MNPNTTEPHAKGEFGEPPPRTRTGRGPAHYLFRGLKAFASLQLTVVLFSLGILLIFYGTLAQLDNGIWTVVEKYFWSWIVDVPFDLFNKFLGVFWKEAFPPGSAWSGSFPFPGGKLIGGLMLVNLLAAHATRFRLRWKRTGVLMIHSGLILLFVGEFITREYAIEQRMTIDEGKSVNFTEDSRHVELAFVDPSDPKTDSVVVIPQSMLMKAKGRITHPDLPVDVEVLEYFTNSVLEKTKPGSTNPADHGLGKIWIAVKRPEVSGLEEQKVDFPAAYVKLYKKGTDDVLGTYLASLYAHVLGGDDEIEVGGKKIETSLRFKRYYKPYRIHLDKFRFDRYVGTQKAKNYSSDVRVYDEDGNLVRQQRIAMNEPLRYAGETFYQQSFDKSETATVLQVVRNPGWLLPYVACVLVGLGLIVHFGIYLLQFLKRGNLARPAATSRTGEAVVELNPGVPLSPLMRYFPWIVLAVMAVYLLSVVGRMGAPKTPVDLDAFGRMPVVEGGRVKPLDTVARVNLRMISGREEVEDENGKKQPAIRWYAEMLAGGSPQQRGPVWKYKLVRIDNEQVLQALGLKPVEGLRYSMEEIGPKIDTIQQRITAMRKKIAENKKLDQTETKFKELHDRLTTFMELAAFGGPLLLPPRTSEEDWTSLHEFRLAARRDASLVAMRDVQARLVATKKIENLTPEDERKLIERIHGIDVDRMRIDPNRRAELLADCIRLLHETPESINDEARWEWILAATSILPEDQRLAVADLYQHTLDVKIAANPAAADWEKLIAAYRDKRPDDFAQAVADYRTVQVATVSAKELTRARVELTFNRFAPFYQCTGLYVLAFVLAVVGFLLNAAQKPHWGVALRQSATYVLILTFTIHVLALVARMYVMDRPLVFVTNLYSSAIFIGLGCVGLCLILERIFPLGIGNVLAAVLGLSTTIVAHNLATEDTLEMMQAVLDTNFWLATHVTTVTLGYTATFVAGFLGAFYVIQMLAAVVRDSYLSTTAPTVGSLLAFGVATTGVVGIPLFFLWFMTTALIKFEILPTALLQSAFWLILVASVTYAAGLILLWVTSESVDAHGKPTSRRIPGLARPVVAMALTPERGKIFGQMVYGVVCFATLLSFVGTVLGGIWADQSWGRFWGWDPKENGAVLIVLWNSLILHARWAGLVKDRGVAVLAIFGNVMTAWSWFGTNQLSIGLHAYGFDSRLADGCFNFWLSQVFILGWGLIPQRFWASAARRPTPAASPGPAAVLPTSPSTDDVPRVPLNGQVNGQPDHYPGKKPGRRR